MSPSQEFAERLASLFALELRRQGVPNVADWVERLHTYGAFLPSHSSTTQADTTTTAAAASSSLSGSGGASSTRHAHPASFIFRLDLSGLEVGDRATVALCEALLKVEPAAARLRTNSIVEWQLILRQCRCTDRVLHHLSLLVTGCPKLTVLDVSRNDFSEQGQSTLLEAAAEVPCDVILHGEDEEEDGLDEEQDKAGASGDSTRSHSPPHDIDVQLSPTKAEASASHRGRSSPQQGTDNSNREGHQFAKLSSSQQHQQQPVSKIRRLQRSPSLTGTSTSVTPSQRSYASGSAEALQRRRDELFGTSTASVGSPSGGTNVISSAATPSTAADGRVGRVHAPPTQSDARQHVTRVEEADDVQHLRSKKEGMLSLPPPQRSPLPAPAPQSDNNNNNNNRVVGFTRTSPSSSPLPIKPPLQQPITSAATARPALEGFDGEDGDTHSPFRTTLTAPHSPSEASRQGFSSARPRSAQSASDSNNNNNNNINNRRGSSSLFFQAGGDVNGFEEGDGADNLNDAAASREPFDDRNDQLDVTANLNPLLDSVLDLSALMSRNGVLRQAHMFGGAMTVWDVLDAYEAAVDQQQQQHRQRRPHEGNNISQQQNIMGSPDDGVRTRGKDHPQQQQHRENDNSSSSSRKEGSVDAGLRAKLPVALLGTTSYHAITVLNLSRNHLTSLCPLPPTLLRLDVSSNDLGELRGLERCKMLTVLNARRNHLREISGLERNLGIAHLFLGHNHISLIEGLAHLVLLETLDVTFNELRTQSSIRMLSLCSALRHVLLRGNPLVEQNVKPGFNAVLRNLCPTLLVVDDQRVGSAALAERALQHRGWGKQPNLITARTREGSTSGTGGRSSYSNIHPPPRSSPLHSGLASQPLARAASRAIRAAEGAGELNDTSSSLPFTASRRRTSIGRAPFAVSADDISITTTTTSRNKHYNSREIADDGVDEEALDLLHLLTRGVTAPTGYGDATNAQHAAQQFAKLQRVKEEKERARRERQLTANGRPLRKAVVKQLAEESRKYVEDTIVRRLTTQQSLQDSQLLLHPHEQNRQRASDERDAAHAGMRSSAASPRATTPSAERHEEARPPRGREVVGSVNSPARSLSPKPKSTTTTTAPNNLISTAVTTSTSAAATSALTTTAAAAAAAVAAMDPNTAEVLRRYELRTKPLKRRPPTAAKPHVATTHAAQLRAASARRSVSGSTSRAQSPAREENKVSSPNSAAEMDRGKPSPPTRGDDVLGGEEKRIRGPGGSRSTAAVPPQQQQQQHAHYINEMDATLDAMYVEEADDRHDDDREYPPHLQRQSPPYNHDKYNPYKDSDREAEAYYCATDHSAEREVARTSYAALHLAERGSPITAAARATSSATNPIQRQQHELNTMQSINEAEIECSPISKDPQARLVTSLNTTASVYERSEYREALAAAAVKAEGMVAGSTTRSASNPRSVAGPAKTSSDGRNTYSVPPALSPRGPSGASRRSLSPAGATGATARNTAQQRGVGVSRVISSPTPQPTRQSNMHAPLKDDPHVVPTPSTRHGLPAEHKTTGGAASIKAAPNARLGDEKTRAGLDAGVLVRKNSSSESKTRYRDPAGVEETAIYPASRSHSRGSHASASASAALTPRNSTGTPSHEPPLQQHQPQAQQRGWRGETHDAVKEPSRAKTPQGGASHGDKMKEERRSQGRTTHNLPPSRQHSRETPQQDPPQPFEQQPSRSASRSAATSPARSRSSSIRPLHIDEAQRARVMAWTGHLHEDAAALQEALQTLVELLEAQRTPMQTSFPESSRELPRTFLEERRRCVGILHESGMLADTQVPMEVVVYYGFSKKELDGEVDRSAEVVARENKSESAWQREVAERSEVLRVVHLLGDAKTCLRYVSLLVGDGRERLLQQYVDQLKESLRS